MEKTLSEKRHYCASNQQSEGNNNGEHPTNSPKEEDINKDNSLSIPIVKTKAFEEYGYEFVGDDWLFTNLIQFIHKRNIQFSNWLNQGTPLKIHQFWMFSILLALVVFYNIEVKDNYPKLSIIKYLTLYCITVLDLTYALVILVAFLSLVIRSIKLEKLDVASLWIHLHHCAILVFLGIYSYFYCDAFWWLFLVGSQIVNLAYLVIILEWIIVSPIIIVIGILDAMFRILICKMKCPSLERKARSYTYGLYKFNMKFPLKGIKTCTICLQDFVKGNADICSLQCHITHCFHEECIFEWLKNKKVCPICRSEIVFNAKLAI